MLACEGELRDAADDDERWLSLWIERGRAAARRGALHAGIEWAGRVEAAARRYGHPRAVGRALLVRAQIAVRRDDREHASEAAAEAVRLFEVAGDADDLAAAHAVLTEC